MRTLQLLLLLALCSVLTALEVGGHISTNTTWGPENNPYIVINNIYVDSGVDLTILPGTVIKFHAAQLSYDTMVFDFLINSLGESVAKLIYVNGRIIAVGTEQDSITFTRYEETPDNMRWGNIVFAPSAPKSVFRHCRIMYPFRSQPSITSIYEGGLCCQNGKLDVSYCRFVDHRTGIWMGNVTEPLLVEHNVFQQYHWYPYNFSPIGFWLFSVNNGAEIILAYNQFYGQGDPSTFDGPGESLSYPITLLYNYYNLTLQGTRKDNQHLRTVTSGDAFGNQVIDCEFAGVGSYTVGYDSKGFIRRNTLVNSNGISAFRHMEISDNILVDCNRLEANDNSNIDIYNNRLKNTVIYHTGTGSIYNNVVYDFSNLSAFNINPGVSVLRNNIAYNGMGYPINYHDEPLATIIENNLFWNVHILNHDPFTYATFRNNCMSIPLPNQCIDGGGNIIGLNPLFADPDNGDFHLLTGSPCIDAGYDTTGYTLFDNEYYHRVVDGNNDGDAVIDMGAFEYGSGYLGGFEGHIYLEENVPLPLAKVDIVGVTREYSDSLGYFRFNAPSGTYTLIVHHIFEGDSTFEVVITEGQTTTGDFYYNPIGIDDSIAPEPGRISLNVYPNPFNPETTISYTLPQKGAVEVSIYNLRGQLVKRLVKAEQDATTHSTVWNGKNRVGKKCSSGIYIVKCTLDGKAGSSKKIILAK